MNPRYTEASKYLKVLERSFNKGWRSFHDEGLDTIFHKLALIHPSHYADLDLPSHLTVESIQRSVQGPRRFGQSILVSKCQSCILWGYNCELGGDLQQDHLFPYSFGGPADGRNRIILCRYHNMDKTSDIHCFPWESTEQWIEPWLDGQIDRLHQEVFKIYDDV